MLLACSVNTPIDDNRSYLLLIASRVLCELGQKFQRHLIASGPFLVDHQQKRSFKLGEGRQALLNLGSLFQETWVLNCLNCSPWRFVPDGDVNLGVQKGRRRESAGMIETGMALVFNQATNMARPCFVASLHVV